MDIQKFLIYIYIKTDIYIFRVFYSGGFPSRLLIRRICIVPVCAFLGLDIGPIRCPKKLILTDSSFPSAWGPMMHMLHAGVCTLVVWP